MSLHCPGLLPVPFPPPLPTDIDPDKYPELSCIQSPAPHLLLGVPPVTPAYRDGEGAHLRLASSTAKDLGTSAFSRRCSGEPGTGGKQSWLERGAQTPPDPVGASGPQWLLRSLSCPRPGRGAVGPRLTQYHRGKQWHQCSRAASKGQVVPAG